MMDTMYTIGLLEHLFRTHCLAMKSLWYVLDDDSNEVSDTEMAPHNAKTSVLDGNEDHGEEFEDESQLDDKPWSDDSESEFENDK